MHCFFGKFEQMVREFFDKGGPKKVPWKTKGNEFTRTLNELEESNEILSSCILNKKRTEKP